MKFVIFHGAYGSPEGNWFPQLREQLEALGQEVRIPQFPTPRNQSLEAWLKVFDGIRKTFKKGEALCFIGHSLGPLFILHVVDTYKLKLDSAIFVSPFLTKLNNPQFDTVNKTFYRDDFDFMRLRRLIPTSYTLYSTNDPYVPSKYSIEFAQKLGSSPLIVKRAGHMNSEVNLNEFPLVFELCKTRIDLPLYQRYLAHRRELYVVDYIEGKSEEVVFLKPGEVFDEGVFHFRNLQHEGFCTFYTGFNKFWNTQSKYYEEARKAAKRVKNFTRVFIIDSMDDLKNPHLLEQIKLDIASGIHVYVCRFSDIKNVVPEPDFGIWDNDYLCVVRGSGKGVHEIRLSSRRKEIEEAHHWEKKILAKAKQIKNVDFDIQKFLSRK